MERCYRIILLAIFFMVAFSLSANENKPFNLKKKFKPAVYEKDGQIRGALEFLLSSTTVLKTEAQSEWSYELKFGGTLTMHKWQNQQPLFGEAKILFQKALQRVQEVEIGEVEGEGTDIEWINSNISAGLNLKSERDQHSNKYNEAFGLELGFVNDGCSGDQSLIPSFIVSYDHVQTYNSRTLISLGVKEKTFERFGLQGSLKLDLANLFKGPYSLHLDGRYFKEMNRPEILKAMDLDEYRYYSVALVYTFVKPVLHDLLTGVYLRFSEGKLPPITTKNSQLYVGFILWED